MQIPSNVFKTALARGDAQIGPGSAANPYSAEVVAGAGFDWLLIDGEHAPNTVPTILAHLQAIAPYPSQPVVRVPWNDPVIVKQVLDLGAQTLLVPMVQSADEARAAVAATRYPPHGIRGVGSALARASRWNRVGDYLHRANDEMAVLVQVETRAGPMRSMRLRGSKVWTVCSSGRRISRLISASRQSGTSGCAGGNRWRDPDDQGGWQGAGDFERR